MSDIIDFKKKNSERVLSELREGYKQLTGEDPKYDETLKRQQDKLYDLSCRVWEMYENYSQEPQPESPILNWQIDDEIGSEFTVGSRIIRQFDCDIVLTSVYGSNLTNAIGLVETSGVEDIYEGLQNYFNQYNLTFNGICK